jgi:hypothetical protein
MFLDDRESEQENQRHGEVFKERKKLKIPKI